VCAALYVHENADLLQQVTSHLRDPVGSPPHDLGVVGDMMDLAEGDEQPTGLSSTADPSAFEELPGRVARALGVT